MTHYTSFKLGRSPDDGRGFWVLFPLFGLLVALLLLFFVLLRPGRVEGDSMVPTLYPEERFLSTMGYEEPRLGDVIVFDVRDERDNHIRLVKRVVALPGDTVLLEGDAVFVNGRELRATVVDSGSREPVIGPVEVEPGHVVVMGDNRPVALDSRDFGPVPMFSVHGRVLAVFWPPSRMRLVR